MPRSRMRTRPASHSTTPPPHPLSAHPSPAAMLRRAQTLKTTGGRTPSSQDTTSQQEGSTASSPSGTSRPAPVSAGSTPMSSRSLRSPGPRTDATSRAVASTRTSLCGILVLRRVRYSPHASVLFALMRPSSRSASHPSTAVLETQQAFIIDLRRPKYTLEQVPLPQSQNESNEAGPSEPPSTSAPPPTDAAESSPVPHYPLPPDPLPAITLDSSAYTTAVFTPDGKFVFAGTSKGYLHVIDPQTGKTIAKLSATAPSGIRELAFDRTGNKLVINATDRTIRTFLVEYDHGVLSPHGRSTWPFPPPITSDLQHETDTKTAVESESNMDLDSAAAAADTAEDNNPHASPNAVVLMPVHKLIDLVNRTPWNGIGWSGHGGEYVHAGAAHKASHNIYIWDMATGTLEKVLQGPKDPLVDVDWHPTRPVIASVCSTGAVHFWFSKSEEAWSAYAPQFQELEENIQYEEREEEFDLEDQDELSRRKQDEEEALVDVSGTFAPRLLPPGMPLLVAPKNDPEPRHIEISDVNGDTKPVNPDRLGGEDGLNQHLISNGDGVQREGSHHVEARAAFTWRWVRTGANGIPESYEADDDVDPHFVVPVQLEDGNSSSDGSSRSD